MLRETAVGSGAFTPIGTISGFSPGFGPSFLSVSPDGTRAAVGANGSGKITVFNTAAPTAAVTYNGASYDFDAAWADNNRLAVSNSAGVQVLNLTTSAFTTAVGNVGGASGGVAFDASGNLYTGNGYDYAPGGTDTGYVKEFSKSAWEAAAAGGTTLNFETNGAAVADLLSAGSLNFDAAGNLTVGGGDFYGGSGDAGYAALVSASAVQAAVLAGSQTPPITASSASVRTFASPQSAIDNAEPSIWVRNEATGELYLRYFGEAGVAVYSVPEPAGLAGLLLAGVAALRRRRRAVGAAALAAASTARAAYVYDPLDFATQVVASTNLPATGLYNDPAAVLGRPTLRFNNGTATAPDLRRAKLIEGAFNTGPSGENLVTTFNAGQSVTVKMGRAVTDDPSHPFGVDFNVFGNAFFQPLTTGGFTGDDTNLNTTTVGSAFTEGVRVSVSPDNQSWYTYPQTGDGLFPTNSYRWDRASATWSDDETDPTKAVNPALVGALAGRTAADVLDLYEGAAGGVGFDLAASGFASVRYVRFDGVSGFSGGEIDAVAAVPEPAAGALVVLMTSGFLSRYGRERVRVRAATARSPA